MNKRQICFWLGFVLSSSVLLAAPDPAPATSVLFITLAAGFVVGWLFFSPLDA